MKSSFHFLMLSHLCGFMEREPEEGKCVQGNGAFARCLEDHKVFDERPAVMWQPADTRGHYPLSAAHQKTPALLQDTKGTLMTVVSSPAQSC